MPAPPSKAAQRDADDTDSDTDQVVADQDDYHEKHHDHGLDDGELSSDGESDAEVSEARRREALEHMARIEKEFAELKDRLYQERMSSLTREIEQITNGGHPDFADQLNNLDKKKIEKLRVAELWRNYQFECVENIYQAECQHAENEHLNERQSLREQMLSALQEKVKRLEDEKNSMEITTAIRTDTNNEFTARAPTTRKQRRKNLEQLEPKATKKRIIAGPQSLTALKESEIQEDLWAIRKNNPQVSRRAAAAQKSLATNFVI